ncbi:MAG: hypothetical protein M1814_004967 [Vezdaea aestivalis]|nr:MAG: hypothetical protein M1814_004967 [Vezdaea aestivalis]
MPAFDVLNTDIHLRCPRGLPGRDEVDWPPGYGPESFASTRELCGTGVGCACPASRQMAPNAPRCDFWWGVPELQEPLPDSPGSCVPDPASPQFRNPFGNLDDAPQISYFAAYCRRWCSCDSGGNRNSLELVRPQPVSTSTKESETATATASVVATANVRRPPLYPGRSRSSAALGQCSTSSSSASLEGSSNLRALGSSQCPSRRSCTSIRQCAVDEGQGRGTGCTCATLVDEADEQGYFPPMHCVSGALLNLAIRTGLGARGGKRLGGRDLNGRGPGEPASQVVGKWACPCNSTFVAEACCDGGGNYIYGHQNLLKGRSLSEILEV